MTNNCKNLKYEDTIQCSLYCTQEKDNIQWESLLQSINEFISSLSQEYIWHRDDFKLHLSIFEERKKDIPCHLSSTTCFGDNIEDEWFIVYLILQITKNYQNIIAQIEDTDGDFLLIEAANYLPSWANPDSTENRVFIFQGKIHIINPLIVPLNSILSLQEALSIIKNNSEKTKASAEIQQAILERIGNYPQKIESLCHRANVTLPVEIAAALTLKPSLISPIVTAYCNMDALDIKYCRNLQLNNMVTVQTKFTKYLYAMLVQSNSVKTVGFKNTEVDKKNHLGMKLAYGYHIIKKTPTKAEFNSLEYKKFIKSLTNNGYFKDYLDGSKPYKELLDKANEYYLDIESSITSHVNTLLCKLQSTAEFANLVINLSNRHDSNMIPDDDEEWLNVNPEQLNDFLSSKYGKDKNVNSNELLTLQLSSFLNQTSDFEGIEKRNDDDLNDDIIDFDSEEFVKSLEKMLKLVSSDCDAVDDNDDDDSDFDNDGDISTDDMNDVDKELSTKLHDIPEYGGSSSKIVNNLVKSLREEGPSGPSSNILKSIGINKTDLLDSDDE